MSGVQVKAVNCTKSRDDARWPWPGQFSLLAVIGAYFPTDHLARTAQVQRLAPA